MIGLAIEIGGARRDRTVDLLHAMQALSQLSYSPISRTGRILGAHLGSVNIIFDRDPEVFGNRNKYLTPTNGAMPSPSHAAPA